VSNGGSADPVSTISESMVYYSSAKHLADAERVLRSLSGAVVLAKGPTTGGADVTVVAGSDVSVNVPGASTAAEVATPAGATGSPIVATLLAAVVSNPTPTGASALAPPTTAETSKIPAFDPRACRAH
jgi:hypothetical protein